ncbi:MAG: AAA family ATPase, partial [Gammaproteobacteria bacterium]|nr:AAA family ATPase [Gammaproteobacteria bacterium]
MIPRSEHVEVILGRLKSVQAVAILGPRQIGKTTLARQVARQAAGPVHWLDLENPADLNRLIDDPLLVLDELRGMVVIDEVQRRPDLFPVLRVLADRRPRPARFLILGSASPDMIRQSSESLAG